MNTLTIEQKESNTGSIHDLASGNHDRVINMTGYEYANVIPAYFGGAGYWRHYTLETAIKMHNKLSDYDGLTLLDREGNTLTLSYGHVMETEYRGDVIAS